MCSEIKERKKEKKERKKQTNKGLKTIRLDTTIKTINLGLSFVPLIRDQGTNIAAEQDH